MESREALKIKVMRELERSDPSIFLTLLAITGAMVLFAGCNFYCDHQVVKQKLGMAEVICERCGIVYDSYDSWKEMTWRKK